MVVVQKFKVVVSVDGTSRRYSVRGAFKNYSERFCDIRTGGLYLTHNCLVDPSILINWTSPFPIFGMYGVPFSFFILFQIETPVSNQCRP